MKTKVCRECGVEKEREANFHRNSRYSDGFEGKCRPCRAAIAKQYRVRNYDKVLEQVRDYQRNNREYFRTYNRKWRDKQKQLGEFETEALKTFTHYMSEVVSSTTAEERIDYHRSTEVLVRPDVLMKYDTCHWCDTFDSVERVGQVRDHGEKVSVSALVECSHSNSIVVWFLMSKEAWKGYTS